MKTALLAGSTGLIGKQLLNFLLKSDRYDQVIALSRTPLEIKSERLKNVIVDFDKLEEYRERLQADDIFCCLGTTIKKARSKENFKKVDRDYPYRLAQITKELGASQYLLVSALGADKDSTVFYNQVKGETEDRIKAIGFNSFHVFRPSLLLGARDEERSGEDAAKIFFKLFGFLVPKKYKAIDSAKVAQAMANYANQDKAGIHVHESYALQSF